MYAAPRGITLGGEMAEFGTAINVDASWDQAAVGFPIAPDNPKTEYVKVGPGRFTPTIPHVLPAECDDITRQFGFRALEAMLTDPAVSSSYLGIKLGILDGPIKIHPAVRPKGYREGQTFRPKDGGKSLTPEEKTAVEVAEFQRRDLKRLAYKGKSFKQFLMGSLDAMAFGCKLGERVCEEIKGGPDAGKLGLKSINLKPWWSYNFVVDSVLDCKYVLTYVPPGSGIANGGYMMVPRDHFTLFSWMPVNNDPRGTSCLRPAYDWWNLKRQIMPFYYQHLRRFGSPSLDMMMSETDTSPRPPLDPTTGVEIAGAAPVPATTRMTQALLAYQNNSVIVRPFGSEFNVIEPNSTGESFLHAFDLFDRAICLAIEIQTRAKMEAKNGSKADSETAQDSRGLVISYGRESLAEFGEREVLYESTRINFGDDIAEQFTPQLVVGKVEQQDRPAMITSVTGAGFTIGPSQLEELDTELDLPERDMEADDARAQQQMQQQADMATQVAKSKGEPPPGGQKAKPAPAKAKPKPKG